jgi:Arc/MetJ family transcription regulator
MKTSITIDNALISDALQATGLTATDEVVEMALKLLIQIKHQDRIKAFRGKLPWDGDLDEMRRDA